MKKIILSVAILGATISANAQVQKGFYVKPTASYFTKVTPVEFPNVGSLQPRETVLSINPTTGVSSTVSDKTITGSFGQGTRFGLVFGYQFNDVLALELAANYYTSENKTMVKQSAFVANTTTQLLSLESVGKVKAIDIAPTLVLNIPTKCKIKPYTKIGVILPVGGYLEINTDVNDLTGAIAKTVNPAFKQVVLNRSESIKANPTIGFTSALGLNIPLTKSISVITELEYRNISISSKSKELNAFTATGTTAAGTKVPVALADLPYYAKNVVYQDELNASSNVSGNAGFDATKAANDLKSFINIGGLGLTVGLKVKL